MQTGRELENRAFSLSQNDPCRCWSHSARLHDTHTPPPPALKNTPQLSHCHVNVDWRKNGGTYTIARVWEPLQEVLGLSSTGEPICAASMQTIRR
jgi:hypothetical protein